MSIAIKHRARQWSWDIYIIPADAAPAAKKKRANVTWSSFGQMSDVLASFGNEPGDWALSMSKQWGHGGKVSTFTWFVGSEVNVFYSDPQAYTEHGAR